MKKLFTQHPTAVGETYKEHFKVAFPSGFKLFFAGLACMVHSVFPFLFINTASQTVKSIHDRMMARHTGQPQR